ncbi:chorismate mutase [Mycobacterium triplex]
MVRFRIQGSTFFQSAKRLQAQKRTRRKEQHQNNTGVAGMSVEMIDIEQLANIEELRLEIDRLDAEILAAVRRRAEVSREIGRARMASGGTRLVHSREMKVIQRYSELGPEGKDLAMLLLRLGRGRLGH